MAMDKYQKMMSRFMKEMNPDIFQATDDPDVYDAVLSPEKIKAFQNYLDRLKKEDEEKAKGMLTGDVNTYMNSNAIDEQVTNYKDKEANPKETQIAKGYHQMPNGSTMKDSEMEEEYSTDVAKDLDDEGRGLKGYKPPSEPEKRGYMQDDGGNYSVDTTDDYWQTKKGYDEALDLYGTKPAWVKEPSLIYNPKTKKYDPIEKEEIVDLKPKIDLSAFA